MSMDYRVAEIAERVGPDADFTDIRRDVVEHHPQVIGLERSQLVQAVQDSIKSGTPLPRTLPPAETPKPVNGKSDMLRGAKNYSDLSATMKKRVVALVSECVAEGVEDWKVALDRVREKFGWPYSDKSFTVGPWKQAVRKSRNGAAKNGTAKSAKKKRRPTGPRIYWREGRAYGDFRTFSDVGGGREALAEPGQTWGTTDEEIAQAIFATRLAELEEKHRRRVLAAADAPPPSEGDCITFRTALGEFTAQPVGKRWRVALTVEVDRTTALSLQGQAFALLFPQPKP